MPRQLRDPQFRKEIRRVVESLHGQCALVGAVGVQIHLAAAIGLDKRGPPAHAIDVVVFGDAQMPKQPGIWPIRAVDAMGFEASIAADRTLIAVEGEPFPVASPEHVLGLLLATPDLLADAKWACFALMRTLNGRLDLEQSRGLLKRCASVDRQALLAELAYLAA